MAVLESHDVWRGDVSVLVGLSWVVRSNSSFRCKWKLRYHVADLAFALSSSRLLGGRLTFLAIRCFSRLLLLHLLLHHQLLGVGLYSLESLALPKTIDVQALHGLSSFLIDGSWQYVISSCNFHSFVALSAWRPRRYLLLHITTQRCSFVCGVPVRLSLLREALVRSISEHLRTLNHPSSASSRRPVGFAAIFIDSILLVHEIVKHLRIHLIASIDMSLLTWWLLDNIHWVQWHHLMISKLTPHPSLPHLALAI